MKTVQIVEKYSNKYVSIEGDLVDGMKACINRNERFEKSGMRGEYRVAMITHLSPSEYPDIVKSLEGKGK